MTSLVHGQLSKLQGRFGAMKQLAGLGAAAGVIVGGSYLAFMQDLVFPPMVPSLITFACAGTLTLLDRSLRTSAQLDRVIASAQRGLGATPKVQSLRSIAETISRLSGTTGSLVPLADRDGFARKFGATAGVNSSDGKAVQRIMRMTNGEGVDVAIEAVGLTTTFDIRQGIVGVGGHIANIGVHGKPAVLHLEKLWDRNIALTTRLVDTVTTPM